MLGIALVLSAVQIQSAQDQYPKQTGLHAQQGVDVIPEPQVVRAGSGDFLIDAATVVYADPRLQDVSPVTSLQEGLGEALQLQVAKTDSQRPANVVVLSLVPEADLREVPAGNARKEAYSLRISRSQITLEAAYPAGLFYGVQTLLQMAEQGRGRV